MTRRLVQRAEWWAVLAGAILLGAFLAFSVDRAASPANAQAGGGFTLSISQLRINQRISSAAVRRSNEALRRLDESGGGSQGPAGPPGPPAQSISTYDTYVHSLPFGGQADLATNGPLRYVARCVLNEGGNDYVRVFAISTVPNAYSTDNGSTALTPNNETLAFQAGNTTGAIGFHNRVNDDASYVRSGGNDHYLAIDGETLAMGLNINGPGCVVAGSSFQSTTPVAP